MIKDRMYEQASINTERQEKGNFQKRPRLQFLVIHEGLTRRYVVESACVTMAGFFMVSISEDFIK